MCDFCENGKVEHGNSSGDGFDTMKQMLNMFWGKGSYQKYEDGIWLKGNKLCYESSSGEYSSQSVTIEYCPFCGEELEVSGDADGA